MSRGIYSTYFTKDEEAAIRRIAKDNATSLNYVVRVAVRKLAGLPAPDLTTSAKSATSSN
jgi:hypothetical protein